VKRPIYLDHHATTPLDPRVLDAMRPFLEEEFGNASSRTHIYGWRAEAAVEDARERLASAIGASDPSEIVFTSGTTESDNLAVFGVLRATRERNGLAVSAIEHPAVLDPARALEREGAALALVPVDERGRVDPKDVDRAMDERTALVSVMTANSEVGTVQPIAEIASLCRERGVPFHTDAAQAAGKLPLDVQAAGVDLLSMCAHKLYGPKGVGLLYVRSGRPRLRLEPMIHGGGHERGLRSGTLPVPLIVGFAKAVELCLDRLEQDTAHVAGLRDRLWGRLEAELPDVARLGDPEHALSGNLSIAFGGVAADALLVALPDVALSTGSACASGSAAPSHVLAAMGVPAEQAGAVVRIGLGRTNTPDEIEQAASRIVQEVRAAREASRI
jgi:cysteine desulfurase